MRDAADSRSEQLTRALRNAAKEIETLKREHDAVAQRAREPIAIVALGCRLPGGVEDPAAFWRLLDAGENAISEVPSERWNADAWYDPDPEVPGTIVSRYGGFVRGLESFDAALFGLSAREAESIDPQERLLLEVTYEALERAGLTPARMNGSATGVYVGLCGTEYQARLMADAQQINAYSLLGTAHSAVAGRLSYWLGLRGPNVAIDTACSSSLVAVHLAAQALRAGECDLALAGGANVVLAPEASVYFSRLRALSPTGQCRAFSADADGYVRAEGAGMVVLARLSYAQQEKLPVLALVRGSAVNQDGRSNGLTAPSGRAQQEVIRAALARAGVAPSEVQYVECHGTGTPLGDPIEVHALGAALAEGRACESRVTLGSLKTNVGHLEGAAGIAGLIKVVLALEHGRIPRSLFASSLNPRIAWDALPVRVAADASEWPRGEAPRIAGVSSFGFSGTNAHVIVQEAPPHVEVAAPEVRPDASYVLVVSGHSEDALAANAARLSLQLAREPACSARDLAWSSWSTRDALPVRLAVQVREADAAAGFPALRAQLTEFEQTRRAPRQHGAVTPQAHRPGRLALLFSGQGSQRLDMGRSLYARPGFEVFTRAFDAAAAACDAHLERSIAAVMWPAAPNAEAAALLAQTQYAQPALFVLETALARHWLDLGLAPDLLVGHSIGELVAAHIADVFSLEDAARLVCARGRAMQAHATPGGAMASLAASEREVRAAIAALDARLGTVEIAALNAPLQTVISGDVEAVAALQAFFEKQGKKAARLTVSHAFHSRHMDSMLAVFRDCAASVRYGAPRFALLSNVSGELADVGAGELVTPDYWVAQVRSAVRFAACVERACASGVNSFVEVGPVPVLSALTRACVAEREAGAVAVLPSLREGVDDADMIASAVAGLHTRGHALDAAALFRERGARRVPLPTYAFQRKRYWIEAGARAGQRTEEPRRTSGWLGAKLRSPLAGAQFTRELSHAELCASRAHGAAAALLELAREVAAAHRPSCSAHIEVAELESGWSIPPAGAQRVHVVVTPTAAASDTLQVYVADAANEAAAWQRILEARLSVGFDDAREPAIEPPPFDADPPSSLLRTPDAHAILVGRVAAEGALWVRLAIVPLGADRARWREGAWLRALALAVCRPMRKSTCGEPYVSAWSTADVRNAAHGGGEPTVGARPTADVQPEAHADERIARVTDLARKGERGARFDVTWLSTDGRVLERCSGVEVAWPAHAPSELAAREPQAVLAQTLEETANHALARVALDDDLLAAGMDSLQLASLVGELGRRMGQRTSVASLHAHAARLPSSQRAISQRLILSWLHTLGMASADPRDAKPARACAAFAEPIAPARSSSPLEHAYAGVLGHARARSALWTDASGVTLEAVSMGDAPQLAVLLPPFGCEAPAWAGLLEALAPSRTVVAINLPGYGRAPLQPEVDRVEQVASAVAAIALALSQERPIDVLGWSLGGFVAQVIAARAPALVRTLTLINTTDCLGLTDGTAADEEAVLLRMQTDLERNLARLPPALARACEARIYAGRETRSVSAAVHGSALIATFDHRGEGARICAPTLIVAGAEDLPLPLFHARRLHAAIPRSRLSVLARAGHYIPLFHADALLALLTEHLD